MPVENHSKRTVEFLISFFFLIRFDSILMSWGGMVHQHVDYIVINQYIELLMNSSETKKKLFFNYQSGYNNKDFFVRKKYALI